MSGIDEDHLAQLKFRCAPGSVEALEESFLEQRRVESAMASTAADPPLPRKPLSVDQLVVFGFIGPCSPADKWFVLSRRLRNRKKPMSADLCAFFNKTMSGVTGPFIPDPGLRTDTFPYTYKTESCFWMENETNKRSPPYIWASTLNREKQYEEKVRLWNHVISDIPRYPKRAYWKNVAEKVAFDAYDIMKKGDVARLVLEQLDNVHVGKFSIIDGRRVPVYSEHIRYLARKSDVAWLFHPRPHHREESIDDESHDRDWSFNVLRVMHYQRELIMMDRKYRDEIAELKEKIADDERYVKRCSNTSYEQMMEIKSLREKVWSLYTPEQKMAENKLKYLDELSRAPPVPTPVVVVTPLTREQQRNAESIRIMEEGKDYETLGRLMHQLFRDYPRTNRDAKVEAVMAFCGDYYGFDVMTARPGDRIKLPADHPLITDEWRSGVQVDDITRTVEELFVDNSQDLWCVPIKWTNGFGKWRSYYTKEKEKAAKMDVS